ncbi:MAG: hypothetical protein FJ117_19305 [Deltaproteobacteria bacterium]|nr:hypothetical protein [Deltaproteobacteria bacterium]
MEAADEPHDESNGLMDFKKEIRAFFFFIFSSMVLVFPLSAQERIIGEGEHRGFIVNEGRQVFKVSPIKPGQTIQVFLSPHWIIETGGKVEWNLADQDEVRLQASSKTNPEVEPAILEWTSNSQPRPSAYTINVLGMGGSFSGEILGQFTMQVYLWDQNDGNAGTDAPETYEKALLLPVSEPGTYLFEENFISGTADVYDIFKINIKPNHSLTLKATPLHWQGSGQKSIVRWEFLNKSFRLMKGGSSPFPQLTPFAVKVFHPQVKAETKPALFYLLVKIEGEVSLIYTLQAEMKEGR